MGPCLYSEIGKKARVDLLYKDYLTDQKFTITTYTSSGVGLLMQPTQALPPPSPDLPPKEIQPQCFQMQTSCPGSWHGSSNYSFGYKEKIDFTFGEIQSNLKNKNMTVDVKATSDSKRFKTYLLFFARLLC